MDKAHSKRLHRAVHHPAIQRIVHHPIVKHGGHFADLFAVLLPTLDFDKALVMSIGVPIAIVILLSIIADAD